jgi:cytochrome oxidase assembly protein ShyY1
MLRFLLKPKWIGLGIFAVVMTVLCVRLGFWQLNRLQGRRYYNHLFAAGMAMAPAPVEHLVDTSTGVSLLYRQA